MRAIERFSSHDELLKADEIQLGRNGVPSVGIQNHHRLGVRLTRRLLPVGRGPNTGSDDALLTVDLHLEILTLEGGRDVVSLAIVVRLAVKPLESTILPG